MTIIVVFENIIITPDNIIILILESFASYLQLKTIEATGFPIKSGMTHDALFSRDAIIFI